MANIALPSLSFPAVGGSAKAFGGLLKSPYARVTAPAGVLGLLLVMLVILFVPAGAGPGTQLPLGGALAKAPTEWLKGLKPLAGPVKPTEGMVHLTEGPGGHGAAAGHAAPADSFGAAALPVAPIAGLYENGPSGPLPVIAPDGQTPFEAYSRPFISSGRPKIALVIGGLGLNTRETQAAIDTLPPEITLSFSPYAEGLQGWIDQARARGHEVLLEAPMEPVDYPDNDPGPYTLMADQAAPDTVKKVEWILSRATGYFALTNYLGSEFLSSEAAYTALTSSLKARGLGFIDDGQGKALNGGGLPRASAEKMIDTRLSRAAIDNQLLALEAAALQKGQALGAGFAYPVTVKVVEAWAKVVQDRGYQLAPASALAKSAGGGDHSASAGLTKAPHAAH